MLTFSLAFLHTRLFCGESIRVATTASVIKLLARSGVYVIIPAGSHAITLTHLLRESADPLSCKQNF